MLPDSDHSTRILDGYGSPTSPPFAQTVDPFQVIVDNENCNVFFSGLAPGFVRVISSQFLRASGRGGWKLADLYPKPVCQQRYRDSVRSVVSLFGRDGCRRS